MKKVIFILGHNGGCGRSYLAFLLGEKFPQATIVDMDGACHSISHYLSYRKPWDVSCQNEKKVMEMEGFINFFERVRSHSNNLFICDTAQTGSHFLKRSLQSDPAPFLEAIAKYGLSVEFYCVLGPDRVKKSSDYIDVQLDVDIQKEEVFPLPNGISYGIDPCSNIGYTETIFQAIGKKIPVSVWKNEYLLWNERSTEFLEQYCHDRKLPLMSLERISRLVNKRYTHLDREYDQLLLDIPQVMNTGKGLSAANGECLEILKEAISDLTIKL